MRKPRSSRCFPPSTANTTRKPVPTRVDLTHDDPVVGQVLCDDLDQVYVDELGENLGALSRPTMTRVGDGLRVALKL